MDDQEIEKTTEHEAADAAVSGAEAATHAEAAAPPADPHAILADLEALLERDLPPLTFQLVQDGFAKIRTAIAA